VIAVAATVVGGIILLLLIPYFQQPNITSSWSLTSDQPGTSKIVLDVHNDGDRTVTGCIGHWTIVDRATGEQLVSVYTNLFDVPAHGAAVPDSGTESKPFVRFSASSLPPVRNAPADIDMDITCNGYHSKSVWSTQW
jgi:hypothetical protein